MLINQLIWIISLYNASSLILILVISIQQF